MISEAEEHRDRRYAGPGAHARPPVLRCGQSVVPPLAGSVGSCGDVVAFRACATERKGRRDERSDGGMPGLRPGGDAQERARSPGAAGPPVPRLPPPLHRPERDAVLRLPLPARHHRPRRALVSALPPELRRRGRAARRARRARRPLDGLRLGARVRPALRGRRAPLPPRRREQLERRRDLHQGRGQAGLRLPGHRRARPGRRRLREPAARDRGRGGLLPPRHRGHRRRPGRGDDRRRGRLPARAGRGPPARRARDGQGGPAADRARPPAPEGAAAPDARLQDARRGAGALPGARLPAQPARRLLRPRATGRRHGCLAAAAGGAGVGRPDGASWGADARNNRLLICACPSACTCASHHRTTQRNPRSSGAPPITGLAMPPCRGRAPRRGGVPARRRQLAAGQAEASRRAIRDRPPGAGQAARTLLPGARRPGGHVRSAAHASRRAPQLRRGDEPGRAAPADHGNVRRSAARTWHIVHDQAGRVGRGAQVRGAGQRQQVGDPAAAARTDTGPGPPFPVHCGGAHCGPRPLCALPRRASPSAPAGWRRHPSPR